MARRFLFLAISSLAASCGGGGGGGGPGGGTSSFALTEANALEAATYALSSAEEAFISSVIAVNVGLQLWEENKTQLTFSCGPGSATQIQLSYEDRNASGTLNAGDVVRFQHGHCGGETRNLSLTLSVFEPIDGRIEGRVDFDSSLDPAFRFAGSTTLSVTSDSASTRWRTSNVSLTLTASGTQQSVRIGSSEMVAMPTSYEFSTAGGSVESARLGGSYAFSTTAPLTGNRRRLPTTGVLLLSTSSGSRASITPPATPAPGDETVDYTVAAPNGSFSTARQARWIDLIRGDLFDWQPNRAPVISLLTMHPAIPAPGMAIFASYDVSDPDEGDTLTIEITWRRNGVVVATSGQSQTLPTVRNDVVEVTLTVRDDRGMATTRKTSVTTGNAPPVLTSLSITPPLPDTTADLVVVADVSDPDGDPLQAAYVWRRNGTVLAGQTTATLPASETTRGDSFVVNATFSDDGLTATGQAFTMILDAVPRVAVAAPPVSTAYGMPTGFTASASDPDGDPVDPQLRFAVAYGPAGMTVDPATGVVAWTPGGPMFDRTLDVNWGITLDWEGAHVATGTVRVEDPVRPYPLLRTGTQIPLLGSLRVGDFDDDGDAELLLLGVRWLLEIEADGAGGYRQSWAYPFAFDPDDQYSPFGTPRAMTTGDVDGDGRHEIFVATDNDLVKLDGVERRVVASVEIGPDERCTDVEYGDLDGDGTAELVCAALTDSHSERLVVYRAGDLSERFALAPAAYGSLTLGNVDADAALEIVTSGGYVIDGATTAVEWQRAQGFRHVATGNVDGSGSDEIVAFVNFGELAAFRAGVATPLFSIPSEPLDTIIVADIDRDARAEILAGGNQHGDVTAYRYDPGTGTASVVFQVDNQDHGVSAFGVGDTDGDSEIEIVWGTGLSNSGPDKLVVARHDPAIAIEWSSADPLQLVGPFVGGALARSPVDPAAPLFVTQTGESGPPGARLVRLDPVDGTIEIGPLLGTTASSLFSTLAVDDYDADGTDEALLASIGPFDATPTVYDFFGENIEWTPAQFEPAVQLASGNVYGDSRDELVWLGLNGVVSVLDVATQQLIWQSHVLDGARGLRLADIDGSGESEIIAVTPSSMHVFWRAAPPEPFQLADSFTFAGNVADVTAGDTDGDGRGEIFVLVNPPNNPPSSVSPSFVAHFDSERRAREPFALPWRALTIGIEPSTFARKNLLVGRAEGGLPAGRLVTIDARNGAVVSESPPLIGGIARDSVHYVDIGSGAVRLSIGTEAGMYLTR